MSSLDHLVADRSGCAAAHARLRRDVAGLTDADIRRPSLLPGWTVGHVLNHLRRNAEGLAGMVRAAAADEIVDQYPSAAARAAGIADGADAAAAELVAGVQRSIDELELAFATLSPAQWAHGTGRTLEREIPIADVPLRRWREVEVHQADLGGGFTSDDWPDAYVRRELPAFTAIWTSRRPMGLTGLPPEVLALSPPRRLAWLLGRIEVPGVAPAGVYG